MEMIIRCSNYKVIHLHLVDDWGNSKLEGSEGAHYSRVSLQECFPGWQILPRIEDLLQFTDNMSWMHHKKRWLDVYTNVAFEINLVDICCQVMGKIRKYHITSIKTAKGKTPILCILLPLPEIRNRAPRDDPTWWPLTWAVDPGVTNYIESCCTCWYPWLALKAKTLWGKFSCLICKHVLISTPPAIRLALSLGAFWKARLPTVIRTNTKIYYIKKFSPLQSFFSEPPQIRLPQCLEFLNKALIGKLRKTEQISWI